ncbi:MAG: response regulator transcription factor [Pseudomonadota bacterium]
MQKHILFVEDDELIRENYSEILRNEGYRVTACEERHEAIALASEELPDIALLDITLGSDRNAGYHLCTELRKKSEILPIIFLTSHGSDIDKISGIRLGADDYLTKETSVDYLVARIDALLARTEVFMSAGQHDTGDENQVGDLALDKNKYVAYWQSNPLDLSLTQYWILQELVRQPGEVRSARELMKAANIMVEPNTIAAHIKTIRKKFRDYDADFNNIKTEYSSGYRWLEQ